MTMRSVRMVLGGLVLICSGCASAPQPQPADVEPGYPAYSDQSPYADHLGNYQWTAGWAHFRL